MELAASLLAILAFSVAAPAAVPDLAEILAGPPSSDYAEANDIAFAINGPLDAHRYAEWLAATSSDVPNYEAAFQDDGFTRGYARSWSALSATRPPTGGSRRNYLVETVEEYSSGDGARSRFDAIQRYTKGGGDDFVREIETSIPNSFGAIIFSGANYFVMFVRGDDLYIVRFQSDFDDMTEAVVKQAEAQAEMAPPYTIPPSQWTAAHQSSSTPSVDLKGIASLTIVILVFAARAIGFVVGLVRRRPG